MSSSPQDGSPTPVTYNYAVPGDDFTRAGEASGKTKALLKQLGFSPEAVRRVAIAMYEGEINMVIHANGGNAQVDIFPNRVEVLLSDTGPGIADIELAMREGYSTATSEVRALGFGAGMGLPNIKKYADELNIQSAPGKGTDLYMVFHAH